MYVLLEMKLLRARAGGEQKMCDFGKALAGKSALDFCQSLSII